MKAERNFFAMSYGHEQIVREATCCDYLWDFVLSDLGDITKSCILLAFSDHKLVFATFQFSFTKQFCASRIVWVYRPGDWDSFNEFL